MDGFSILGGFSGRFVWHPDLRFLCSFRKQFPFPTIYIATHDAHE